MGGVAAANKTGQHIFFGSSLIRLPSLRGVLNNEDVLLQIYQDEVPHQRLWVG
jgi:hypothetical protein